MIPDSSPKVPDRAVYGPVYGPVSEALVVVGAVGESVAGSVQDVVYWTVWGPSHRVVRQGVTVAVGEAVQEEVAGP